MKEICVLDKKFREYISDEAISDRVAVLADMINTDYAGEEVVFVGILNGAFMFAADLYRRISVSSRITFVKLASYQGTSSSGTVRELIGWNEDISNRNIIVVEDIIDSGSTLERIVDELVIRKVASVRIAALLLKPEAYEKDIPLDYIGFKIPNDFVVGYGLDYDGFGRNLPSIFTLIR